MADPTRNEDAHTNHESIHTDDTDGTPCPECGGDLTRAPDQNETVCSECGLIVDEIRLDRGPEWRAFTQQETRARSRAGPPATQLLHDRGLTTRIDWRNIDAAGRQLPASTRETLNRLRRWDERFRTYSSTDRTLKQGLAELKRMAAALGLPAATQETAAVIYRRAIEADLARGRSIEGMATAAVYTAARQAGTPRSLDELTAVSRIDRQELASTYRYVARELGLDLEPTDPRAYLPRFASELDVTEPTERQARTLLEHAKDDGTLSGKSPVGLAAAALYAASQLTGETLYQREICAVANVSEVTIRNRYPELLPTDIDTE